MAWSLSGWIGPVACGAKCSGLLAHFYGQKNYLSHDSLASHASLDILAYRQKKRIVQ